jgi:hypothetical protein
VPAGCVLHTGEQGIDKRRGDQLRVQVLALGEVVKRHLAAGRDRGGQPGARELGQLVRLDVLGDAVDLVPLAPSLAGELAAHRQRQRQAPAQDSVDALQRADRHVVKTDHVVPVGEAAALPHVFQRDDPAVPLHMVQLPLEGVEWDGVQPVQRVVRVDRPDAVVVDRDHGMGAGHSAAPRIRRRR